MSKKNIRVGKPHFMNNLLIRISVLQSVGRKTTRLVRQLTDLSNKSFICIVVVLLFFIGFFIERLKNNYSFFVTFYQYDKLPSFNLQLSDFTTENLNIIDNQTFISTISNPVFEFSNGININPAKIKSVLIDAEYSSVQAYVLINALNPDGTWQKEISVPLINSLSYPFEDNKKSDMWYVIRRVTSNNITKMPLIIPCNYSNAGKLRITFISEPDVKIKINQVIINPKLKINFKFQPVEFLSISFLLILIFFFVFLLPFNEKKKNYENVESYTKKPENMFCILAFIFGMIFVFLLPPLQAPDEHYHFVRSYSLSTMHIFPQIREEKIGFNVPYEFNIMLREFYKHFQLMGDRYSYLEYLKYKNLKLSGKEVFREHNPSFPVMHLPQALGMFIIRACENLFFLQDANLLDIFFAGRIFNLLFYIIIGYFSIKTIPFYKYVITAILLMPMTITQTASLSYDSSLIGISLYLICFLFKIYYLKEYFLSRKDAILLIVMASLFVNMKYIYCVIFLILFFIQKEKFNLLFSNKYKNKKKMYIFIFMLVSALSFLMYNMFISNIYRGSEGLFFAIKGANVSGISVKRILSVLKDVNYYRSLLYDLFENRSYYMEGIVGLLAWADTFFPRIFIIISILYITMLSVFDTEHKIMIQSKDKIIYIFIYIFCVILPATVCYGLYGNFPDGRIIGVQGRYFIPVLPLLFTFFYTRLPLSWKAGKIINLSLEKISACFICFSLILTMMLLLFRFYF